MIAAAFYPKDVIVRLSDFKTNEYANLVGGKQYEPVGTCTHLSRLKGGGFAIKASGSKWYSRLNA